jgi:hypothetical protein
VQRQQVPNGSATTEAIDYAPKRWQELTRYLDDIWNNWVENQIRPIAPWEGRTGCSRGACALPNAPPPS